jgi:uncharacterized OsmC-like protein
MTTTTASLNGVDTQTLFATLEAVAEQPSLGRFQFRANTSWVSGTHSKTVITGFYGAGAEHRHATDTVLHSDHPPVLVGRDNGPTPAEYLLHALGACLMAGVGNIAAARGIELDEVTATIEGDIDLQGILGLDPTVRNGFEGIRVHFHVRGAAQAEQLAALIRQSKARSAVYDVLTRGTAVQVDVTAR